MPQILHYANEILDFVRLGFAHVNAILGLIIALFAAFRLGKWAQLWEIALAATLVHIVAVVLIPVVDHNAPIHLPPVLDAVFLRDTVALYLGYVVAIAALFFVRTRLLKGSTGHH
jgi:hypothetical protein